MSFEELKPLPKPAKTSAPVRVGVRAVANSVKPSRLTVLLKDQVLAKLPGGGRRYCVGLGKGEDRHLLKIRPDDDAGLFQATELKARGNTGTFRIMLPPNDRWPICKVPMREVAFEIDTKSKAIVITLPDWAWEPAAKADIEKRVK